MTTITDAELDRLHAKGAQLPAEDWARHMPAMCGEDATFFPVGINGKEDPYATARAICGACPVRVNGCRPMILKAERGLPVAARFGLVAGMTPDERFDLDEGGIEPAPYEPRTSVEHGTPRGRRAHARRNETPCEPCVIAQRVEWKRQRDAKKAIGARMAAIRNNDLNNRSTAA